MNKIKKIIPSLLLTLIVAACQQVAVIAVPTTTSIPATLTQIPTFTPAVTTDPTSELVPYYGTPQPAKVIINGKTYDSEIGTTQWISINADGDRVMEIGDAFAIITPKESIPITSKFSFILRLPISVNPTELWYAIFAVTENEIAAQSSKDSVYR
ncbi:MAG TPA: hypothetical protein VK206_15010 [Anaerolineales bacterium]|nr:hypothetical protein [Anaerolineales bacterium]